MNIFQERVVSEKTGIDFKIDRLAEFLKGETFRTLPEDEQRRLESQIDIMASYSDILRRRIEAFQ
jgi:hypothetical protein